MNRIERVISGGQTGADQGGLVAAKSLGIPTGGFLPKGCTTLDGPRPDLLMAYGLEEHESSEYPPRTYANVQASAGTIRFAADFNSAGERCTLKAIRFYKRPKFDVRLSSPLPVEDAAAWVREHGIRVLNVAGNTESRAPGIQQFVENYVRDLIKLVNGLGTETNGQGDPVGTHHAP